MKTKRIVLHRRRGRAKIDDREMFKGLQAWNSFITHPDALKGWEVRILEELGVMRR